MSRFAAKLQLHIGATHPKVMRVYSIAAICILSFGTAVAQTTSPDADATTSNGAQQQSAKPAHASGVVHEKGHRKRKAAPAANSKIEVIGYDNGHAKATIDKPLLSMASIGNDLGIRSGTPIRVLLKQSVDSGHAHNGDTLDATLAQSLAGLPAGTPVKLTVVQASPAGALLSYGELSIQVISIGAHAVLSDTISALGQEGKKELSDSAPARGTDAVFAAGQEIDLPAA